MCLRLGSFLTRRKGVISLVTSMKCPLMIPVKVKEVGEMTGNGIGKQKRGT